MKVNWHKRVVHFNVVCVSKAYHEGTQIMRHIPYDALLVLDFVGRFNISMRIEARLGNEKCQVIDFTTGLNGKAVAIEVLMTHNEYPVWLLYTDTPAHDGITADDIRNEAAICYEIFTREIK